MTSILAFLSSFLFLFAFWWKIKKENTFTHVSSIVFPLPWICAGVSWKLEGELYPQRFAFGPFEVLQYCVPLAAVSVWIVMLIIHHPRFQFWKSKEVVTSTVPDKEAEKEWPDL